jgi:hypothetical protein
MGYERRHERSSLLNLKMSLDNFATGPGIARSPPSQF